MINHTYIRKILELPLSIRNNFKNRTKRLDVKGDGYCGYYVLSLLHYFLNKKVIDVNEVIENMQKCLSENKAINEVVYAKQHYLEYIEIGVYTTRWNINVAVIVQTDIRKYGMRKKRVYNIYTLNYKSNRDWVFIFMSKRGKHYELLISENSPLFSEETAKDIFKAFREEWPKNLVRAVDQLPFLNTSDYIFIK